MKKITLIASVLLAFFTAVASAHGPVRQKAEDAAPLVFQARRGVALEIVELGAGPWVKVQHRDGQTGFVRTNQVWGL